MIVKGRSGNKITFRSKGFLVSGSLILLFSNFGCGCCMHGESHLQNPAWLTKLIQQQESQPVANPPASITRYEYSGQIVYFLPQQCCDIPSMVYDVKGNVICHPDGGITGKGDMRCPDFFDKRTNEKLIWKDARKIPPER